MELLEYKKIENGIKSADTYDFHFDKLSTPEDVVALFEYMKDSGYTVEGSVSPVYDSEVTLMTPPPSYGSTEEFRERLGEMDWEEVKYIGIRGFCNGSRYSGSVIPGEIDGKVVLIIDKEKTRETSGETAVLHGFQK